MYCKREYGWIIRDKNCLLLEDDQSKHVDESIQIEHVENGEPPILNKIMHAGLRVHGQRQFLAIH